MPLTFKSELGILQALTCLGSIQMLVFEWILGLGFKTAFKMLTNAEPSFILHALSGA